MLQCSLRLCSASVLPPTTPTSTFSVSPNLQPSRHSVLATAAPLALALLIPAAKMQMEAYRGPFAVAVQELCRPLLLSKKEKEKKEKKGEEEEDDDDDDDDIPLRRVGLAGVTTGVLAVPLLMGGRFAVCATLSKERVRCGPCFESSSTQGTRKANTCNFYLGLGHLRRLPLRGSYLHDCQPRARAHHELASSAQCVARRRI